MWCLNMYESVSEVAQSCPTLCGSVDCSPPGSSVRGILQARILEWAAISFSKDLLNSGIEPGSPALQADALLSEPPGKPFKLCLVLHRVGHHPCITDKKTSLERLCKLPSRRKYLTLIKKDRAEGGDDQLHFSTSCIIPPVWVFHLFHTLYQACISTTGTVWKTSNEGIF